MGKTLSGAALKRIAVICMIIDHVGYIFYRGSDPVTYTMLRVIGRLAFPLFAFGIAEGFEHTRDRMKYLKTLLLFALISEVPFDLALYHTPFSLERQNVFFTLALGLTALMLTEKARLTGDRRLFLAGWLGPALLAFFAHTDYDAGGVLLILMFQMVKEFDEESLPKRYFWPALLLLFFGGLDSLCILAIPLILLYNGERGEMRSKYFFYWIYPVHLLVLAGMYRLLL